MPNFFLKLLLSLSFLMMSLHSFSSGFSNQIFKDGIHSVLLKNEKSASNEPVIILNSGQQLTLRFDELGNKTKNYSYTLVHCNPDWSPSDLYANEYLNSFQEENITAYLFSSNTTQNFVHYYVSFPNNNLSISKSGNYVVVVFEDFDRNKIVLTQKLFVIDNQVNIVPLPSMSLDNQTQLTHHQICFKVNQNNLQVGDPMRELNLVVLQNFNYSSQLFNLSPTFINGKIYSYEGSKLNMEGGNEFNTFDSRNINENNQGYGVHKVVFENKQYHVILTPSSSKGKQSYSLLADHNGERYIRSQTWKSEYSEADYAWVYFYLNSPEDSTSEVYIFGELTNWEKIPEAKMKYNPVSKQYVGKLFLKQGVYDYAFLSENANKQLSWQKFEGSHYQTQNNYYIFMYYKRFSNNYFEIVGAKKLTYR